MSPQCDTLTPYEMRTHRPLLKPRCLAYRGRLHKAFTRSWKQVFFS